MLRDLHYFRIGNYKQAEIFVIEHVCIFKVLNPFEIKTSDSLLAPWPIFAYKNRQRGERSSLNITRIVLKYSRKNIIHTEKKRFCYGNKIRDIFLLLQPKILLQQPNVLLIELNILLL